MLVNIPYMEHMGMGMAERFGYGSRRRGNPDVVGTSKIRRRDLVMELLRVFQMAGRCIDSYGHLSVISTYNPIYRMYNPIYNQL